MQRACTLRGENLTFTSISCEKAEVGQPQKLPLSEAAATAKQVVTAQSSFRIIQCSTVQEMGWRCMGEFPLLDTKAQSQGPGRDQQVRTEGRDLRNGNQARAMTSGHGRLGQGNVLLLFVCFLVYRSLVRMF